MFFIVLVILLISSPCCYCNGGISSPSEPFTNQCPLQLMHNTTIQNGERVTVNITEPVEGGGWFMPHTYAELTGPCNIKKVNWTLSNSEFINRYAYTEPVILTGLSDQSVSNVLIETLSKFKRYSTRHQLLSDYGDDLITVTTANTYSYPKVKMTLHEYVDRVMKPQLPGVLGKDTLYHFGDNDRTAWADLFSHYSIPPYSIPPLEPVLSFGLAGPGTGVPFHVHGPTFAETIYGRKRWFLYPPDASPQFDPDVSTLDWVSTVYPSLPEDSRPLECVLHPGEIIFFPNMWWHATLNLDAAVFMSTFLA